MGQIFTVMQEEFRDPARVHAMMVHFPIAVSILGLVLLFFLTVAGGRSPGMRWACVIVYLIGAGIAIAAKMSGDNAAEQLTPNRNAAADVVLNDHYEAGEKVWIPLAITTLFVALTAINITGVRVLTLVAAILAALFSLAWVSYTGYLGGQLVYAHGVGVPASQNNTVREEEPAQPPPKATVAPHPKTTQPAHAPPTAPATQPDADVPATAPASPDHE